MYVYNNITRSTFIDVNKLNFDWVLGKGGSGHLAVCLLNYTPNFKITLYYLLVLELWKLLLNFD